MLRAADLRQALEAEGVDASGLDLVEAAEQVNRIASMDGDMVRAFKEFHWGDPPDRIGWADDPRYEGETLVQLGKMSEVAYTTNKGGEVFEFVHRFDDPPCLCADSAGRLAIVGGTYQVTKRGIEG